MAQEEKDTQGLDQQHELDEMTHDHHILKEKTSSKLAAVGQPLPRSKSEPDTIYATNTNDQPPPVPPLVHHTSNPTHVHAAHTFNADTNATHADRPTRAQSRRMRASEEFDRRYDGPFGRPSMHATRRRSSQLLPGVRQEDEREDIVDVAGLTSPTDGSRLRPGENGRNTLEPAQTGYGFQPVPPPLNYTLRTRVWAIIIFWSILVFDSVVEPIVLYFGLWYGVGPGAPAEKQTLTANTVFSIVTAAIGGASILEYFVRMWRLWRKNSKCRVIGSEGKKHERWYLDWFHWWFTIAWLIVMLELIVGSVQEDPFIRLLAMPLATMLYVFGTLLILIDILHYYGVPAPCRISSMPKGSQLRPGIYPLIEDICAVDGSGGQEFRINLDKRYEGSHVFRAMLRRLGFFWAIGAEGCAALTTGLVFGLESKDAAYTVGWTLPFVWAGFWGWATVIYVQREVKKERKLWADEAAKVRNEGGSESLTV